MAQKGNAAELGTENIRKLLVQYAVPAIIAMTAYAMDGDEELFLQAGMSAYLAKPVHMEDIRQAIETVTAQHNA